VRTQPEPSTPSFPSSASSGGLAARRALAQKLPHGMSIETGAQSHLKRKTIRACDDFFQLYTLGREVCPSTHCGVEVRYGMPHHGGGEVVVKVRDKAGAFQADSDGEKAREWREATELVLNLPQSELMAQIIEVLEDAKAYYVVMEKVEGKDLCDTLLSGDTMPIDDVKEVLRQLLTALVKLHGRGVIHRDLKLENVMLSRGDGSEGGSDRSRRSSQNCSPCGSRASSPGCAPSDCGSAVSVKVIDFDTLEVEARPGEVSCGGSPREIHGTDQYLPPEAYSGEYSRSSDMFAVGAIAYTLVTGNYPFNDAIFEGMSPGDYYADSPKMQDVKRQLSNFKVNWNFPVFRNDLLARDFVQRMMAIDKHRRPSAKHALQHTWLAGPHRPT